MNGKEYDEALAAFRLASQAFSKVQQAYRARTIGDDEFIAGRKAFDVAQGVMDDALLAELAV